MNKYLIWIIGKDQYSEGIIHFLKQNDDFLIATTNVEYVDDKVRILAPCDMKSLKADVIILPYSYNMSIGKFGRVTLDNDFFINQKEALFFTSVLSNYSKIFADRLGLKIKCFFDLDEVKKVKGEAIVDLVLTSLVEHSELLLKHTDFAILKDDEITPYFIEKFSKLNVKYTLGDNIEELTDNNVIIIPASYEINKAFIDSLKQTPIILINLYEENISFSVIRNGLIKKIYSLRMTKYAKYSYTYAFANSITNKLREDN